MKLPYKNIRAPKEVGISTRIGSDQTANVVVLKPTWITILDVSTTTVCVLAALSTALFVTLVVVDFVGKGRKNE